MPMFARSIRIYGWLMRLYPGSVRRADLEAAFVACLTRERARRGTAGLASAWAHILLDTVMCASRLHLEEWRLRRHALPRSSGDPLMTTLWQDIRSAVRGIGRAPFFSAIVVLTLGLGIGANTAIFSVINGVLLQPLPYASADRLAYLYAGMPKVFKDPIGFSAPDYTGFVERARSYENIAVFRTKKYELSGIDVPARLTGARVSYSLFPVLGVEPALGRTFTRQEDADGHRVVVLTDGLWRGTFGSDPAIIGRTVPIDREQYTVVGIMRPGFVFPSRGPVLNNEPAAFYVPISFTGVELQSFGNMYNNSVVARLKPDVTISQAESEARAVMGQIVQQLYPPALRQSGFELSAFVLPARDEIVGRISTLLLVLMAAVAAVLLIACADVANLMLTRAAARGREMAIRTALGASRSRLIRQVLAETGMLAFCGGVLGLCLATWGTSALLALAPVDLPRAHEIAADWRVLGFTLGLSMATALLCGILPAVEASRGDSGNSLKEGTRGATQTKRQRRLFGALVSAQFALAVVLLIAGGLLIRSFNRLWATDPGFRPERVLTLTTSLPANAYADGPSMRAFHQRLLDRVQTLPAVKAVGLSTFLPLSVLERRSFTIENQPEVSASTPHLVAHDWVAGRYFEALGVSLESGRYLTEADHAASEPVVMINHTMAQRFWPGANPIGQRIKWGGRQSPARWLRIVGITPDVKQGPLHTTTIPQTFQPYLQVYDSLIAENVVGVFRSMKLSVRTETDPTTIVGAIRAVVHELDPSLPMTDVQTMEDVLWTSASPQRFNTWLLSVFAAVALVLAAIGVGGVLASAASQRTREIGVRMALGAERRDVLLMVLRQGMTLVALGCAVGLPAAFMLTRLMSSLLFEIGPRDPMTFAGVTAVLAVVAIAACYVPAHRATLVNPIAAIRDE